MPKRINHKRNIRLPVPSGSRHHIYSDLIAPYEVVIHTYAVHSERSDVSPAVPRHCCQHAREYHKVESHYGFVCQFKKKYYIEIFIAKL